MEEGIAAVINAGDTVLNFKQMVAVFLSAQILINYHGCLKLQMWRPNLHWTCHNMTLMKLTGSTIHYLQNDYNFLELLFSKIIIFKLSNFQRIIVKLW